jgi:hypothetical protein
MVLLAFSLQDQVEKYGAYVAIACFFGLAVLSLLYFAQARELRRLRDWAGRSPERPEDLEARVDALADALRRVPQQAPARRAVPQPVAVATNGAHKLKPEQVAALAFARAAGVPRPPHPPQPAPAAAPVPVPQPVAVAAEAPPEAAVSPPPLPGPATAVEEPAPVTGNGHGRGDVPGPVTPAARRVPAAPVRATPPPRRPAPAPARRVASGPPPRRETSARSIVLTLVFGVIVLAAVAFAGVKVLGGGSDKPSSVRNPVVTPGQTASSDGGGSAKPKPTPAPTRETTTVMVLNGTTETGLAATTKDRLLTAGYAAKNTDAGNNPASDQKRTASVVMYKTGARAKARDVARVLDIQGVQPIDPATQANGGGKDVIVVVGSDKSGS